MHRQCLLAWNAMVSRIQGLVLGFFVVVWVSLLVILVVAPEVFDQALRLPGGRGAELAVLAALSGFIGVLAVGVARRWRWTFWLILVAFLFGVLRVPVAALQLTGVLATKTPAWYVLYQGAARRGPVRHRADHDGRLPPLGPVGRQLTLPAPVRPARDQQRRTPAGP